MKKTWKKLLTVGCAISLLTAMPGMTVLADEMQNATVVSSADDVIEIVNATEISDTEQLFSDESAEDVPQESSEEVEAVDIEGVDDPGDVAATAGDEKYTVGDGVTATFDEATGAVEFYSDGGTLWADWTDKAGIDKDHIVSINVASGTVYLPADSSGYDEWDYFVFGGLNYLEDLDLSGFDASNVTNMSYMFRNCHNLTSLNLSGFNSSSVTDMSYMFSGCRNLTNLKLSGLVTSNVTDMRCMFEDCYSLTNLDLSNFNTSKVKYMQLMFRNCNSLAELDLSSFNTSNVKYMYYMFSGCHDLIELDLSNFNTSNVTDMEKLFEDCESLVNLDMSNFDTSKVNYYSGIFSNCGSLSFLNTPKKNSIPIELPIAMYDETGNVYTELPDLSKSITLTKNFIRSITDCTVYLGTQSYTYDGKAKKPTVTVKHDTITLSQGTDYTVTYTNNTDAGTATVKIKGIGNYKDEKSVSFKINKVAPNLTFAASAVTKKTTDAAFTNTLTKTTDGTVTFKSSDAKIAAVNSTSGLVSIKGAGTVTITATASEGKNYKAGSASYSLAVKAPAPTATPTPKPTATPTPKPTATPTPKPTAKPASASTSKPTISGFSDVQDPKHAYYKAIYWAADAGITKGYPDGTFGINRSCTRGEMMMFLWRYAGKPAAKTVSKSPFKDVPKTHTFYKAILWGSQKGITKGYSDGTFGVDRNVSRGECMMFLWRLRGKPAPTAVSKSPFTDVPKNHVFYNAILWGAQKKITTGYTSGEKKGTFGINENCTRGQIVTFLYRAK